MDVAPQKGMGARRYTDLIAWQLSCELKRQVYELVDRSRARDDRRFYDQIRNSAASAPSNLAEGFGLYRHPDFARYTRIAKASLLETQNHLRDGVDRRHWSAREATPLLELADRAVGACVRLLRFLETTTAPGTSRGS
jgi:four helix bundle protein